MNRADILDTAKGYVTQDRNVTHGEPEETFGLIAAYWSAHLGIAVSETDVAALMTLFKLARLKANPTNPENWVDGCGYLACGGEIAAQQARSATERAATDPQAASGATDTRQPTPGVYGAEIGAWARNSYTALHAKLIGPDTGAGDGALFSSGWTPETEDEHINKIADERASGPFVSVSLDDLTTEG